MSDLTGELLHMAADGASQARPMTATEVIRRGNRRRARTIGQRSLGGLSALGVGAAIIMTGAATHGPAGNPAAASASGGVLTLTGTSSSSAGTMTVTVKYRDKPHNKIELLSLSYSGRTPKVIKHLTVLIGFGPSFPSLTGRRLVRSAPPVLLLGLSRLSPNRSHDFAGSLALTALRITRQHGGLSSDEALRATLATEMKTKDGWTTIGGTSGGVPSVGLVLTR